MKANAPKRKYKPQHRVMAEDAKYRGWLHLQHPDGLFRQPNFQGLPECLIPILLQWTIANYTRQWLFVYNLIAVYLILLVKYFTTSIFDDARAPSTRTPPMIDAQSTLLVLAYASGMYYVWDSAEQLIHFVAVIATIECSVRAFVGSFTLCEIFTLVSLFSNYIYFGGKQLFQLKYTPELLMSQAGNAQFNCIIFLPWVAFGLFCLTNSLIRNSLVSSTLVIGVLIQQSLSVELDFVQFVQRVLMDQESLISIAYMAAVLSIGLPMLHLVNLKQEFAKLTIRKFFHFLALVLFLPPLFYLEQNDARMQMMIFAFNCVTVLLMLVEYIRCQMPSESGLNTYFGQYCDEREEAESTLILSHIYLLIGCASAPTITFVLVNGGFVPQDFAVMSLCGVVFLGLGDSTAALYGKAFGASKWRSTSLKSQEGSTMCVIVCSIAFFLICYVQSTDMMREAFLLIFFATIGVAALEGFTHQFDNLVCPVAYFIFLIYLWDFFTSI